MTLTFALILTISTAHVAQAAPSVRRTICKTFGSRCAQALKVARCESRFRPLALGRAGERGVFQIHPVHFGWVDENRLWDPAYNARIAWRLSKHGTDWGPWTCRRVL